MPRKRTHDEMVASSSEPPAPLQEHDMRHEIRNMWEFAALFEYLSIFGQAVKTPDVDIEDLEIECTKSSWSRTLDDMGLALLKWVSSQRALNFDNWDEYTRRQYRDHAPNRNPYGSDDEEPNKFRDFHIFTKLRVLYQLAVWTFRNPDRMRSYFADKDVDHFLDWQAHPNGWDRHDRIYYLLRGNRLYRRTDPPIPEPTKVKAKYTSKKAQAQRRRARTSKRRRVVESDDADTEMNDVDDSVNETQIDAETSTILQQNDIDPEKMNTFGDLEWECVAVTLNEYNAFLATIAKSKDPNEQNLRSLIEDEAIPELEKEEAKRLLRHAARLKETEMAEKLIGAKRSGRLAAKQEREREEAETAAADRERQALLAEAHREEERKYKMEHERQSRMLTREQRIKEREFKRVLMEEQLARDSEEERKMEEEGSWQSRHLKKRIEKHKKELEEFSEDEWTFDCSGCGQHGKNFDDGEHSIACERCSVWQHSKCLGFSKSAAESDDFHFICSDCRRKEEDANRPKISLKFKVGQSSSPPQPTPSSPTETRNESPVKQKLISVDVPPANGSHHPSTSGVVVNGQFYPALDPSRSAQPALSPSAAPVTLPSMPGYATKQTNRPVPATNGIYQYQHNGFNGYPPQERLPGSSYAQSLYNQVTFPAHQQQHPQHNVYSSPQSQPQYTSFRPASSHSQTPRPPSNHSQANGHSSPVRQRIPSPIINRPTMSPTQGNPDVGPIAGVPGSSPLMQPATMATPFNNGNHSSHAMPQRTPHQQTLSRNSSFSASQQSTTQPISGLSPVKQRTSPSPLPQPSLVPKKQGPYTTPSSSFNAHTSRTVSGTPIFPPAENLAPSPQQLNREPVPTPSKHSLPLPYTTSGVENALDGSRSPVNITSTPTADAIGFVRSISISDQEQRQQPEAVQ